MSPLTLTRSLTVPQAIRNHNAALTDLYFQHRETVQQLQNALLTRVLPNVVDELGLGNATRDWAQEWVQDDRTSLSFSAQRSASRFLIPSLTPQKFNNNNNSVHIPHPQGESAITR